jgi:hypothetical protein
MCPASRQQTRLCKVLGAVTLGDFHLEMNWNNKPTDLSPSYGRGTALQNDIIT